MYRFHTLGFKQSDGLVHYLEAFIINLNENFLVSEVKLVHTCKYPLTFNLKTSLTAEE